MMTDTLCIKQTRSYCLKGREIEMVRLIHFSDIHFSNQTSAGVFDRDDDIKCEVLRDLKERVKKDGPCDAILVTGDIAYSGKKEEYDNAANWLEQAREIAGCENSMILVCPGNHDVDRSVHTANSVIRDAQISIGRGKDVNAREYELYKRLDQDEAARMLFAPLDAFNNFASRYGSSYYTDDSFVLEKDLPLNDGSRLRVRGMNSALLSFDDHDRNKLLLGSRAWTMHREDGVTFLAMAHHPPSWLFDEQEADNAIRDRALIHLFGHEHNQRVDRDKHWCRIYAGSINPHRQETQWKPGYNIVCLEVDDDSDQRLLKVKIDVREWVRAPEAKFQTLVDRDGEEYYEAEYLLPEWEAPQPQNKSPVPAEKVDSISSTEPNFVTDDTAARDVMKKFFKLTLSRRNQILGKLDLIDEAESKLPDFERHRRALVRAREMGLFLKLDEEIDTREKK